MASKTDSVNQDLPENDIEQVELTTSELQETDNLTDQERTKLFEKGIEFKRQGNCNHALLCLLGCLKGLKPASHFLFLPQCLQEIAGLYAKCDDYEKAVQFMQAAKLYFETAIIESGAKLNALKKGEGVGEDYEYEPVDESASKEDACRANEYERLSHSCLKDKKIQLALEYCGKATQIRRKLYGDNHPVTVKSLDLFTVTYAEMGKLQYSEAMDKMANSPKEKHTLAESDMNKDQNLVVKSNIHSDEKLAANSGEAQGFTFNESDNIDHKNIDTDSPQLVSSSSPQEDNFVWSKRHMLLLILISAFIAVAATYIWCYFTGSKGCPSNGYASHKLKFYYYYYVRSWFTKKQYF